MSIQLYRTSKCSLYAYIFVNLDYALWPFPIQNLTSEIYESIFGHLVGLLRLGFSPSQGQYLHTTEQHRKTRTHIHTSSEIRTHDPSVRAVEDCTCLRPRGHWDGQAYIYIYICECVRVVKSRRMR
jgi:hypothetical protein